MRLPRGNVWLCAVAAILLAAGLLFWRSRKHSVRGALSPESSIPGSVATPGNPLPVSKLPGPARTSNPEGFLLNDTNAQRMEGMDDPQNERWSDVAGNYYSAHFVRGFSYAQTGEVPPTVRIRISERGPTLSGRLEARGLKPNFAYQIKLRGLFEDRRVFEAIGYAGRWRLPGRATNYTDLDYEWYPDRANVESYILFDFFVTDRHGDAARNFALDSSLHVLWNRSRQGGMPLADDLLPVVVNSSDRGTYARPKTYQTLELLWAERESARYTAPEQIIRLPPGSCRAELVLTEESFHSIDSDGGYWATVYKAPIAFTIDPEQAAPSRIEVDSAPLFQ